MGCVGNGPGESKHAGIRISLPGTFEEPKAPVYVDGRLKLTLKGDTIVADFLKILEDYIETRYGAGAGAAAGAGPRADARAAPPPQPTQLPPAPSHPAGTTPLPPS